MSNPLVTGLALVVAILPATLSAQCVQPASLRTIPSLQGQSYLIAPGQPGPLQPPTPWPPSSGYRGFANFFDLVANASVTITQIDIDLSDDGLINWGPQQGVPGPPGLVGQTAAVNVFTAPTTPPSIWSVATGPNAPGLALIPPGPGSPWTLAATGTLTVNNGCTPSPVVLTTPLVLAAGSYAVAFEVGPVTTPGAVSWFPPPYPLHPTANLLARVPNTALSVSDPFLRISNHASSSSAFVNVIVNVATLPLANVLDFHYTPAVNSAWFSGYGSGCYDRPQAFYEQFGSCPGNSAVVTLSNTGIQMVPVGSSYLVAPTASPIVPPTTPAVTARVSGFPIQAGTNNVDDVVTGPLPLGFTFPFPGGSTTQIVVGSNGFVHLDPAMTIAGSFPGYFAFSTVTGPPRLAPFFGDLDPTNGGSVHMEPGPGGEQLVTWWSVAEFRFPASLNTIQLAIYPSGIVEYRYGTCSVQSSPAFVGFTPGGNVHVPASQSLIATMPFQTGDGAIPPLLTMSARPVLGTTPSIVTNDMPANAGAFLVLGLSAMQPAGSLAFVGMQGCVQEVNPFHATFFAATGTSGAVPLGPIPNLPMFLGYRVFGQSAVLSPGSNAAGITASNGLCIHLGL